MKSVKKTKARKSGVLRTGKQELENQCFTPSRNSIGFFTPLPREMYFRIFGFIPLTDLGQLSVTSRIFRDEVVEFIHSKEAWPILVPQLYDSNEDSSEVFISVGTDSCFKHFRALGK